MLGRSSLWVIKKVLTSLPFMLSVAMGRVAGCTLVRKYGTNEEITSVTDPEDVWDFGGEYQGFNDVAGDLYISSADAADTMEFEVDGLDELGAVQKKNVVLNGQTPVLIDGSWLRIHYACNSGSTRTQGLVYVYRLSTVTAGVPLDIDVRSFVKVSAQCSLQALYTIPAKTIGFLVSGGVGIRGTGTPSSAGDFMNTHLELKPHGGVFRIGQTVDLQIGSTSIFETTFDAPTVITALTDIKTVAHLVTGSLGIWAVFSIFLIDEKYFSESYLSSINQPGY